VLDAASLDGGLGSSNRHQKMRIGWTREACGSVNGKQVSGSRRHDGVHVNRRDFLKVFSAAAAFSRIGHLGAEAPHARAVFPESDWFRPAKLTRPQGAALDALLRAGATTGCLVVRSGSVLFEYGDVRQTSYIASARKSLVSMLYGRYVRSGMIPLEKTLRALGIDDVGGLLPSELDATIGDLLAARSGVYHSAANLGDAANLALVRGSVRHGTHFLYNNWDFNALGAILGADHESRTL
jgi:CubicO group peptidase (beta-lactamase class C family)